MSLDEDVTRLVVVTAKPEDASPGASEVVTQANERGIPVAVLDDGEADLLVRLVALIGDGRHTLVVGAPGSEHAVAVAAERTGARVLGPSPERQPGTTAPADTALDDLHAEAEDPWGVDSRWYEARKRSLLLAALPRREFRSALEIGSSTGALAEELATRCAQLVVLDASSRAVEAARSRLRGLSAVRVEQMAVPRQWPTPPDGGFDLIVLSEVGYFLSPRDLDEVITNVRADLAQDGVLVLCHWRHEIVGWPLDGPDVHRLVTAAGVRPVAAEYRDRDFELLVLTGSDCLPDPAG